MGMNTENSALMRVEGQPAPGKLLLVHGFLNTWSDELGIEDFATAGATESWLRDTGLWSGSSNLSSTQHRRMLNFREDLRAWVRDRQHDKPISQALSRLSFRVELSESSGVEFHASGDQCDRVIGTLVAAIAEAALVGTWDRLKCCDLTTCGWAFYDATRSRTKRWCSMKTCGSRHKSRAYYKRTK